jgi:glycosyltransferase involved in cell wall biosynthesis
MQILINAPFNSFGYGVTGINLVKALCRLGHDVYITPIGPIQVEDVDIPLFSSLVEKSSFSPYSIPTVKIWHQHDLLSHCGHGKYIGFPIFELDTFSEKELHSLKFPDELFVCSAWAREIIKKNEVVTKTSIVPLGVNRDIFYSNNETQNTTHFVTSGNAYRFFCGGKLEKRKCHHLLVDIFNGAFKPSDDVELYILCESPFLTHEENENYKKSCWATPLGSKIKFIPRCKDSIIVADYMRSCDCGIQLSLAEGWNLEVLELMSCGKPVITTNFSAHTEYCTHENSMLVDIDDTEPAFDGKWFFGQGNWAKFGPDQFDQTVDYMKDAYLNRPNNPKGIETAQKYSWENTAKCVINALDR